MVDKAKLNPSSFEAKRISPESRIGPLALRRIKTASLPPVSVDEKQATLNLEEAQTAKAEARCALQEFIQSHDPAHYSAYERQEHAHLLWDVAKRVTQVKRAKLTYLDIHYAHQEEGKTDADEEINSEVLDALAGAQRDFSQAKLDEAAAKTYFFGQKVEIARENFTILQKPEMTASTLEHMHHFTLKAIYLTAMSQHMAAYLEEAEMKHVDAKEILRGLDEQADATSDVYVYAQRYLKETEDTLADARQAHANVLASVESTKILR